MRSLSHCRCREAANRAAWVHAQRLHAISGCCGRTARRLQPEESPQPAVRALPGSGRTRWRLGPCRLGDRRQACSRGSNGPPVRRGLPILTMNPLAVADSTLTFCDPSGETQVSPTLNIEPSLLDGVGGRHIGIHAVGDPVRIDAMDDHRIARERRLHKCRCGRALPPCTTHSRPRRRPQSDNTIICRFTDPSRLARSSTTLLDRRHRPGPSACAPHRSSPGGRAGGC